jgi:hypothetical protein
MHYAEMKAQGLPVRTGVTDAARKMLITQHLKQSGMSPSESDLRRKLSSFTDAGLVGALFRPDLALRDLAHALGGARTLFALSDVRQTAFAEKMHPDRVRANGPSRHASG